jgi:hypothetical protein
MISIRETLHSTFFRQTKHNACIDELPDGVRLINANTSDSAYSNAQIDDYLFRLPHRYVWKPPVRLTVRAWASHSADELRGTAGFGFWMQPNMESVFQYIPRLPSAIWFFFASPPTNMAFAMGVPGYGWKAMTFDPKRWLFAALAPTAPIAFPLARIPALYRSMWRIGQRAIGSSERLLGVDLREPHDYRLDWLVDSAHFYIDGELVHTAPYSPRGKLGFVAWKDNRYAIITPQGHFSRGALATAGEQWLAMERLRIDPL